jgi:hypothetical protein
LERIGQNRTEITDPVGAGRLAGSPSPTDLQYMSTSFIGHRFGKAILADHGRDRAIPGGIRQ